MVQLRFLGMSFLCMMESDNAVTIDGTDGFNHNVDYLQPHIPREDTVVSDNVIVDGSESTEAAESNGCVSVFVKSDESMMNGSSNGDMNDESITHVEQNGLTITKEGGQSSDHSKQPISQKGQGKSKNEKFQSPKSVFTSSVTKKKYCNDAEETAKLTNGSIASNSRPRQPAKNRSFNERKQQTGKSDAASSEGLVEKTKLKASKKDPVCNIEDESQSSSATEGESKHLRIGTLPNYGFSFRCNERAEKRKEFYSKLEEKIHALEVEKNNMQAKTKETQEAEVKMLRKSLNFKATPMPSFYMEPQPPKVELKKIPPTKAKSPKLGRRKSLPQEPQGNSDPTYCSRPSLDEETSQSPSKGPSMHPKKPQRNSLPILRSQNFSSLSTENECKTVPCKAKEEENNTNNITNEKSPFNSNKQTIVFNPENEENIHISNTINEAQSSVPDAELSEMQLDNDNKPMVEEQSQSI